MNDFSTRLVIELAFKPGDGVTWKGNGEQYVVTAFRVCGTDNSGPFNEYYTIEGKCRRGKDRSKVGTTVVNGKELKKAR